MSDISDKLLKMKFGKRSLSGYFTDQGVEGTCWAHGISRLVARVIKIISKQHFLEINETNHEYDIFYNTIICNKKKTIFGCIKTKLLEQKNKKQKSLEAALLSALLFHFIFKKLLNMYKKGAWHRTARNISPILEYFKTIDITSEIIKEVLDYDNYKMFKSIKPRKFNVRNDVEYRNKGKEWLPGIVVQVNPLMVKPYGDEGTKGKKWDEVRFKPPGPPRNPSTDSDSGSDSSIDSGIDSSIDSGSDSGSRHTTPSDNSLLLNANLPNGWSMATDRSGRAYYYETVLNARPQWEFPSEEAIHQIYDPEIDELFEKLIKQLKTVFSHIKTIPLDLYSSIDLNNFELIEKPERELQPLQRKQVEAIAKEANSRYNTLKFVEYDRDITYRRRTIKSQNIDLVLNLIRKVLNTGLYINITFFPDPLKIKADGHSMTITNIDNNTLTIKNSWGTKGDYEIEDENQSEEELTVNFVEDNKLEWNKLKQLVEDKIIFIELTFIIPTKSSNKYFNNFLNIFKKSRRIAGKLKNKKSKKKKKYLTRRQLRKT